LSRPKHVEQLLTFNFEVLIIKASVNKVALEAVKSVRVKKQMQQYDEI
jgi:hypothetical protein